MTIFDTVRRQKLLSLSLLVFTLAIGIVIGTLVTGGVKAAKEGSPAPDAVPLVIPPVRQLPNEFTKLAKQLEPSVVNISTEYKPKSASARRKGEQEEDEEGEEGGDPMEMWRRFFRQGPGGGSGRGQTPDLPPRAFRREATGSGFIVDKNGYIITNNHVIEDADRIRVTMPHDQTQYKAKLIGSDDETDLAIIKIDAGKTLTPVRIGNSEAVQVGDWAIAIGSPFGLEATVTAGIVSALGRNIEGARQFQRFIQTDAAINPGNSGGPLLNITGEVVGINTAIATRSGGYQGVGFALPINSAVLVYNSIIRSGRVQRGSIGIQFRPYGNAQEMLRALGVKNGVIVQKVNPGGPSDKAGMREDDIIIAYNGQPVKDGDDLVGMVSRAPIGSTQTITVDRNGKRMDLKVTIADREEQLAAFSDDPRNRRRPAPNGGEEIDRPETHTQSRFGISIRPASDPERQAADLKEKAGVVVTQVQEDTFGDEIGLQPKDIITHVNRQVVSTVEDIRRIQTALKPGDPVAFRVMRPLLPIGGRQQPNAKIQYNSFYVSGTLPR
jgi:serine protease Do